MDTIWIIHYTDDPLLHWHGFSSWHR